MAIAGYSWQLLTTNKIPLADTQYIVKTKFHGRIIVPDTISL